VARFVRRFPFPCRFALPFLTVAFALAPHFSLVPKPLFLGMPASLLVVGGSE
jgi:hypothetical protein